MAYRAAIRFHFKEKGKRGPVDWYDPHDLVPDEVSEMVDDRCVYDDSGALAGYPAGGLIDDISGWCLEVREDGPEFRARLESARKVELTGKRRKGLLMFFEDQLRNLDAVAAREAEAAAEEANGGTADQVEA